jgi:hypothetical protein
MTLGGGAPTQPSAGQVATVKLVGVSAHAVAGSVKVWITGTFASSWYADAVEQARLGKGADYRRREISFAVSAIESYLVEWVRDTVLSRRYEELPGIFPPQVKVGIEERWKRTIKELTRRGLIAKGQSFGAKVWSDFTTLVEHRNGLLHGRSSRPFGGHQPADLQPNPSGNALAEFEPGFAVRIVTAPIEDLHAATGTPAPDWLQKL